MIQLLVLAVACVAGTVFADALPSVTGGLALHAVWPPAGLLLGSLLSSPRKEWLLPMGVAGGAMFITLLAGQMAVTTAAAITALTIIETVAIVLVLARIIPDRRVSIARMADVGWFVMTAVAIPLLSGLVVAGGTVMVADAAFVTTWRAWWFAHTLGFVLFAPAVIAVIEGRRAFGSGTREQLIETALVLGLAALVAVLVFEGRDPSVMRVPAYVLPPLLWAAFRLAPGGAAITLPTLCMIALWNTAQGDGPFSQAVTTVGEWILRAQGSMGATSVSVLLVSAVVAERNQTARERAALLTELQNALAEIKTLQGLIPICAWCQKVRDDAGFWQGIEAYVQTHADVTFSHSICPECSQDVHTEIQDTRNLAG